jgi:hypothetical protein
MENKRSRGRPRNAGHNVALLIRVSDSTKALLDKAKDDQMRSIASIVEECIKDCLTARYAPINERINKFLGGK